MKLRSDGRPDGRFAGPWKDPTERQVEVLRTIHSMSGLDGRAPTVRELCVGLGTASTNGVMDHLRALASRGLIERAEKNTARGTRLTAAGLKTIGAACCSCRCHRPSPTTVDLKPNGAKLST